MKFPLRYKLLIAVLLVGALGFLSLALFISPLIRKQAENRAVNKLYGDANYIAASYSVNTGNINKGQVEAIAYASDTTIWIIGVDGNILMSSGTAAPNASSLSDFQPADAIQGFYFRNRFRQTFSEEMITVFAPLVKDADTNGYVLLHYPVSRITKESNSMQLFAFVAFGIFFALLLLFLFYLELFVVRPIGKLEKAGREYANRNLTFPLSVRTKDELRSIAESETEMASLLAESSNDQHQFLANISHDFRSPLTSIRGYITAIEDGTIPPEMQEKYLNVILGETDRLMNLANGLLDMTQLENGSLLNKMNFDLYELMDEVLPTFEGRVREKNIVFDVTKEEGDCTVFADRQRIGQVLHNLTDNAVKFSGNDSTIDFIVRKNGSTVFVSVKDHGVGIEKENINKIWNRFYKTDSSRGKDKKGTGLGLSIVREIIQAHKENIDVISTPGVGTEFIFTLTSAENPED